MKKNTKIILGVVAGIIVIGSIAASADPKSSEPQNTAVEKTETETPKSDIVVSAMELDKEYKANEVAADEKYKGKTLEISGTVESIQKDFMDDPFVVLTTGEYAFGVNCSLENKSDAINLKKGQKVTFIGEGAGMSVGFPMVTGCKLK